MPVLADTRQDPATAVVVGDLIDALLSDELVTIAPSPGCTGGAERWVEVPVGGGRWLGFRARPAVFPQRWRFGRGPVVVRDAAGNVSGPLDAVDVVRALARPTWAALDLVAADLRDAPAAGRQAAEAAPAVAAAVGERGPDLRAGERLAALADRPFHPLGRHKRGWSGADAAQWGPHSRRPFGLAWWAVPRDLLTTGAPEAGTGPEAGTDLADLADVLGAEERERLAAALQRAGVAGGDRLAVPVHPWQARHLTDAGRRPDGVVPVADDLGGFWATASLRTVVPVHRSDLHLKLAIGIAALGAGRQLPVRYLRNGDRAQGLLAAVAAHPALGGRVHVCDESRWWTAAGGELGAQLRRFPPALAPATLGDPDLTLAPLGAFGATVGGLLGPDPLATLTALTREIVRFGTISLAHGIMPELHGQNVMVAIRTSDRSVAGLVLRDHDAVRIHPPWLRDARLPDPGYVVDGRTPNTLVAATPEALFGWFQMLGVHLGLYPILRAATAGGDERGAWAVLAGAAAGALDELDDDADDANDIETANAAAGPRVRRATAVARRQLLHAGSWPVKRILVPLLERGHTCGTSMPSAVGAAPNPLLGCAR
jgi:siderophore synthetase component